MHLSLLPRARRPGAESGSMESSCHQEIGSLLEEFVRERSYVPDEALAVRSSDELPMCLGVRTADVPADAQWRAWSHGSRIWFIVGQLVREACDDPREIVLKMMFYDHDGALAARGAWLRRPTGQWVLTACLPMHADCSNLKAGASLRHIY